MERCTLKVQKNSVIDGKGNPKQSFFGITDTEIAEVEALGFRVIKIGDGAERELYAVWPSMEHISVFISAISGAEVVMTIEENKIARVEVSGLGDDYESYEDFKSLVRQVRLQLLAGIIQKRKDPEIVELDRPEGREKPKPVIIAKPKPESAAKSATPKIANLKPAKAKKAPRIREPKPKEMVAKAANPVEPTPRKPKPQQRSAQVQVQRHLIAVTSEQHEYMLTNKGYSIVEIRYKNCPTTRWAIKYNDLDGLREAVTRYNSTLSVDASDPNAIRIVSTGLTEQYFYWMSLAFGRIFDLPIYIQMATDRPAKRTEPIRQSDDSGPTWEDVQESRRGFMGIHSRKNNARPRQMAGSAR